MFNLERFCARLKQLRTERGWNQETAAGKLFVSSHTLSRWERGLRLPSCEGLALICDLFGVSPNWMLLGEGADET